MVVRCRAAQIEFGRKPPILITIRGSDDRYIRFTYKDEDSLSCFIKHLRKGIHIIMAIDVPGLYISWVS